MTPPHDHAKILGHFNYGDASHVEAAIDSALKARSKWAAYSFVDRATIFLKAADLVAGKYRSKLNASTMLAQSKNCFQAVIDAAGELSDFLRFNASFGDQIMGMQPESADGIWNRTEYRPLEGFVFAVTPFNFTAIAANLPACMALMGNVVVWKPADSQMYSAQVLMEIFKEAGVPDGVINMVTVDGPVAGDVLITLTSLVYTSQDLQLFSVTFGRLLERILQSIRLTLASLVKLEVRTLSLLTLALKLMQL